MENTQNFNQEETINKILEISDKKTKIIIEFIKIKGYSFDNIEQFKSIFKLYKKDAKILEVYPIEKIIKTMEWLKNNADFKWVVSTVLKYIDEPLEKMKAGGKLQTEEDYIKSLKQKHYGAN